MRDDAIGTGDCARTLLDAAVAVDSTVGEGTSITLSFPVDGQVPQSAPTQDSPETTPGAGTAHDTDAAEAA